VENHLHVGASSANLGAGAELACLLAVEDASRVVPDEEDVDRSAGDLGRETLDRDLVHLVVAVQGVQISARTQHKEHDEREATPEQDAAANPLAAAEPLEPGLATSWLSMYLPGLSRRLSRR
jgi:hypothetical protein